MPDYSMDWNNKQALKDLMDLAEYRGYRGANVLIEGLCRVELDNNKEELKLAKAAAKKKRA